MQRVCWSQWCTMSSLWQAWETFPSSPSEMVMLFLSMWFALILWILLDSLYRRCQKAQFTFSRNIEPYVFCILTSYPYFTRVLQVSPVITPFYRWWNWCLLRESDQSCRCSWWSQDSRTWAPHLVCCHPPLEEKVQYSSSMWRTN